MLKACLNGSLRRHEHPAVPITPAEVAADAVRCESAGAAAVHVHPRDEEGGRPSRRTPSTRPSRRCGGRARSCRSG
ncbi:3-keto-5-aminohexanoate cleavage protein [Phytohabitans flavus]|uniref:3-keto-5-aminohexanoate cleavage protein n=1 Tax=Phytohabitans flavus TaxID=1076124 RepID=UPI001E56A230